MKTTKAPRFTERELIMILDNARDYLLALINEGGSMRKRATAQATIDGIRRQLADRHFIGA